VPSHFLSCAQAAQTLIFSIQLKVF